MRAKECQLRGNEPVQKIGYQKGKSKIVSGPAFWTIFLKNLAGKIREKVGSESYNFMNQQGQLYIYYKSFYFYNL